MILENLVYVIKLGRGKSYYERSEDVYRKLADIYSNFLRIWAGIIDTSFGLKFDFKSVKTGKGFFNQIKKNWNALIERVEKIDYSRKFLIGEDRLACELIYSVFYLDYYLRKKRKELWKETSEMIDRLILKLPPEKLSGLLKHYCNSKMFSKKAYEDVLKRVRNANRRAYTLHCMECTQSINLARRDFAGIDAFLPLIKISSSKQTIERVLRITKTDIVSEIKEIKDGYRWRIDVFLEEDGVKWGTITVLLILAKDTGDEQLQKLAEMMLEGYYVLNLDLFFYFTSKVRKLKPYLNGILISEFSAISKFVEDISEYINPEVERVSKKFEVAFNPDELLDCGLSYDYVVDAVRIRVRKKLATHLEYTCLVTKPVKGYYLHFIVLKVDGKRRYICLACKGKVKPKDAYYMFDNAKLKKMFEVCRENGRFFLKPISFEELKKLAENSEEEERKLARIKLKEVGIIV